jgi:antitoxin component of MazEF toxin-antitoxin module
MIKRLTALGNSAALIIDKPILELLHITTQTDLRITTDGKTLTISPLNTLDDSEFKQAHEKVVKRHHNTFKKLAKPV